MMDSRWIVLKVHPPPPPLSSHRLDDGTVLKVWWRWEGVGSFKVHGTYPLAKIEGVQFYRGRGIVLRLICHTLNTKGQLKMPSWPVLFRQLTVVGSRVNQLSFWAGFRENTRPRKINTWQSSSPPRATVGGVNIRRQDVCVLDRPSMNQSSLKAEQARDKEMAESVIGRFVGQSQLSSSTYFVNNKSNLFLGWFLRHYFACRPESLSHFNFSLMLGSCRVQMKVHNEIMIGLKKCCTSSLHVLQGSVG